MGMSIDQPDAEPPIIGHVVDTSEFTQRVIENCNIAPQPPHARHNTRGFDDLYEASKTIDSFGNDGQPLGPHSNEDAKVVRMVSVQGGSVAILYDRELPSMPLFSTDPMTSRSREMLLTHEILKRPKGVAEDKRNHADTLFHPWLYSKRKVVEGAMKYFSVPLNGYLDCRCDSLNEREYVLVINNSSEINSFFKYEDGCLKVMNAIRERRFRWLIPGFKDILDICKEWVEVAEKIHDAGKAAEKVAEAVKAQVPANQKNQKSPEREAGVYLDDAMDEIEPNEVVTAVTDIGESVPSSSTSLVWESDPNKMMMKLSSKSAKKVKIKVRRPIEIMKDRFLRLLRYSVGCDLVEGDEFSLMSDVDCSFSGLVLIGKSHCSAQLEAWGQRDQRDLRTLDLIADKSRDERVIIMTFVSKSRPPIMGKRLHLKVAKGVLSLSKIGVFGTTKERCHPDMQDVFPGHEQYEFLFNDAVLPQQRSQANAIAERRNRSARRLMKFIVSPEILKDAAASKVISQRGRDIIGRVRVRCLCVVTSTNDPSGSGGVLPKKSFLEKSSVRSKQNHDVKVRTFHTFSRYWIGRMQTYFEPKRDPNDGLTLDLGDEPWLQAFQLHFRAVALSSCGTYLAAITHQRFAIWALDTGKLLDCQAIRSLSMSKGGDARRLATRQAPRRVLKSLAWRQVVGDERCAIILGCTNGDILVYEETTTGAALQLELRCIIDGMHDTQVSTLTMTACNNFVISASPPREEIFSMQCILWPYWEIGGREEHMQKTTMKFQIRTNSRDIEILENELIAQRLDLRLHEEIADVLHRWSADRGDGYERERAQMFAQCGVSPKDMQRKIDNRDKVRSKITEAALNLRNAVDRLQLDANLHLSEKSVLVMDDDEEEVQEILQVLVLNHFQVAMLCRKNENFDAAEDDRTSFLYIYVWTLGESRQSPPTTSYKFPQGWVHSDTTACLVTACPSIIACVPDKGFVFCDLVRDFAPKERKKAEERFALFIKFDQLQKINSNLWPCQHMVLLANGSFSDFFQDPVRPVKRTSLSITAATVFGRDDSVDQKSDDVGRFGELIKHGIRPDLLLAGFGAVHEPSSRIAPRASIGSEPGLGATNQQLFRINVDDLLKLFRNVEFRFSKPYAITTKSEDENDSFDVQVLNNLPPPPWNHPTFLLKCRSETQSRVEIWPSPHAEIKGIGEPAWDEVLDEFEDMKLEESESKTAISERRARDEYQEYFLSAFPEDAHDILSRDRLKRYKSNNHPIRVPFSRGTMRRNISSCEGFLIVQLPSGPEVGNELAKMRVYCEAEEFDSSSNRSIAQFDIPVFVKDPLTDPPAVWDLVRIKTETYDLSQDPLKFREDSEWRWTEWCQVKNGTLVPVGREQTPHVSWFRWCKTWMVFFLNDSSQNGRSSMGRSSLGRVVNILVVMELFVFAESRDEAAEQETEARVRYHMLPVRGVAGMGPCATVGLGTFQFRNQDYKDDPDSDKPEFTWGFVLLGKWLQKARHGILLIYDDSKDSWYLDEEHHEQYIEEELVEVMESEGSDWGWEMKCAHKFADPFLLLWKPRCDKTALYYYPIPEKVSIPEDAPPQTDQILRSMTSDPSEKLVIPFMKMKEKTKVLAVLETVHGVLYSTNHDIFYFKRDAVKDWMETKDRKNCKPAEPVFGENGKGETWRKNNEMFKVQYVKEVKFTHHNDTVKDKSYETRTCRGAMSLVSVHRDVFAAGFEGGFNVLFFQFDGGVNNYVALDNQIQMPYLMRTYELEEKLEKRKLRGKKQRESKTLKLCYDTAWRPRTDLKSNIVEEPPYKALMPYVMKFSDLQSAPRKRKYFVIATSVSLYFAPLPSVNHEFLLTPCKDENGRETVSPVAPAFGIVTPMCAHAYQEDELWYVTCQLFHANTHLKLRLTSSDDKQLGEPEGGAEASNACPKALAVFEPPAGSKDKPAIFVLTGSDIKKRVVLGDQVNQTTEDWSIVASWVDDISEHTKDWDGMCISPDGRRLATYATCSGKDGNKNQEVPLRLWDTMLNELNWDGRDRIIMPRVKCACFSQDSKLFIYTTSARFGNRCYVLHADTMAIKWGSGVEYFLEEGEEFESCLSGTDLEASRPTVHVIIKTTHQRLWYQSLESPLNFAITPPWLTANLTTAIEPVWTKSKDEEDGKGEEDDAVVGFQGVETVRRVRVLSENWPEQGRSIHESFRARGLRECGLHSVLEVPNESFSASSYKGSHKPHFARIQPDKSKQERMMAAETMFEAARDNVQNSVKTDEDRESRWWKADPHVVGQEVRGQWLEVDLGASFWVRGLRVQGKKTCYMKSMGLSLSQKPRDQNAETLHVLMDRSSDIKERGQLLHAATTVEEREAGKYAESLEEEDDDKNMRDSCFLLPEPISARYVCVRPYEKGGTKTSIPGMRIEIYHEVPKLMAFHSADRHGQRYFLYYRNPDTEEGLKVCRLEVSIANKMTLGDLIDAYNYKTKDRKTLHQGLQGDLEKFQLLRCALYMTDQNHSLRQIQSIGDVPNRKRKTHSSANSGQPLRTDATSMVLGLGYGKCYWSLLHELCYGDEQHDKVLSWVVDAGDITVPEDASYIAQMLVPAHLLVHAAIPRRWEKCRRGSNSQVHPQLGIGYPVYRPMDVLVHMMIVQNDWDHRLSLLDTLKHVLTQLVNAGEEGWWHLARLIDELPIEVVMTLDVDGFILAVKAKVRRNSNEIKAVDSLIDFDVKGLKPLKDQPGMVQLLVTIPGLLGDPVNPRNSLLFRATHAPHEKASREDFNEKLEAFCGTQFMDLLIRYKWETYIQYLFKLCLLSYLLFLTLYSVVAIQFASLNLDESPRDVYGTIPLLVCSAVYGFWEIFSGVTTKGIDYFVGEDALWNLCDWLIIVSVFVSYICMDLGYRNLDSSMRSFAVSVCSAGSILVWLRTTYYAVGFKEWGQFVHVVFFIFRDSRYFFAMLLVILCGFAQGFYLFYHRYPELEELDGFQNLWMTLITSFTMMLGEYPMENLQTHWVTLVYFVLFGALMTITLLNIIIAKMNDSYATTMKRAAGKYSMTLATQIASSENTFSWLIQWRYADCYKTWLSAVQRQDLRTDEETQQSLRVIDDHCERLMAAMENKMLQLTQTAKAVLENVTTAVLSNQNSSKEMVDFLDRSMTNGMNTDQIRVAVNESIKNALAENGDILQIKNLLLKERTPDPSTSTLSRNIPSTDARTRVSFQSLNDDSPVTPNALAASRAFRITKPRGKTLGSMPEGDSEQGAASTPQENLLALRDDDESSGCHSGSVNVSGSDSDKDGGLTTGRRFVSASSWADDVFPRMKPPGSSPRPDSSQAVHSSPNFVALATEPAGEQSNGGRSQPRRRIRSSRSAPVNSTQRNYGSLLQTEPEGLALQLRTQNTPVSVLRTLQSPEQEGNMTARTMNMSAFVQASASSSEKAIVPTSSPLKKKYRRRKSSVSQSTPLRPQPLTDIG